MNEISKVRFCPVCKKNTEFKEIIAPLIGWFVLNEMLQALQYCTECHVVICILPVEQVKPDSKKIALVKAG